MKKIIELKKPRSKSNLTITKKKDGNYVVSYTEILNKNNEERAIDIAKMIVPAFFKYSPLLSDI